LFHYESPGFLTPSLTRANFGSSIISLTHYPTFLKQTGHWSNVKSQCQAVITPQATWLSGQRKLDNNCHEHLIRARNYHWNGSVMGLLFGRLTFDQTSLLSTRNMKVSWLEVWDQLLSYSIRTTPTYNDSEDSNHASSTARLIHFLDLCDLENVNLPTAGDSNPFQPDAKPYCTECIKAQKGCSGYTSTRRMSNS